MDKTKNEQSLRIKAGINFVIVLFISLGCFLLFQQSQINEAKLNATYTAESTVGKIETLLSRYLENSELIKNIVSSEGGISDRQFSELAGFMKKNKDVIEAYELAPEGIVSQVYPSEGNEEALGLNMLKLPERKREALLAKNSEKYTIAGPYELKQGGTGALLFDPIYIENDQEKEFWGFSILVLDWEKFAEELEIDKLAEAGYHFNIWKYDNNGNKVSIIRCSHNVFDNALDVECSVPNDTWHFEIAPDGGWLPVYQSVLEVLLSIFIAGILTLGFYQVGMRRCREEAYAEHIEKAAKEAQDANAAKTRFLFNMSHDIRTPMNAIVGYSNLLEANVDNKELVLNYIKKIKASNDMLLSLINYTLEMARIESGKVVLKKEKGNLEKFVDILKVVSEPQISKKKLSFCCTLDVTHSCIVCDITKVREIVLNIVSNAIKYTSEGGKIALTIKEFPEDREGYAKYCFEVEDNGIGMSEEYLPHIFEEFSRERTTTESRVFGVGLGLPIVKALVDLMGGDITVESQPNVGTRFRVVISFPIASEADDTEAEKKQEEFSKDIVGKRILLVEDNELNAEIAMTILEEHGLLTEHAEDGEKCLSMLDERPEAYYDAVLMDIQMPKMNGYEATMAIRDSKTKYADIPIIAMTANAFDEDRDKAMQVGMNEYIAKPIDVEKLFYLLRKVL